MTIGELRYIMSSAEEQVKRINNYVSVEAPIDDETRMLEKASETIETLIAIVSGFQI